MLPLRVQFQPGLGKGTSKVSWFHTPSSSYLELPSCLSHLLESMRVLGKWRAQQLLCVPKINISSLPTLGVTSKLSKPTPDSRTIGQTKLKSEKMNSDTCFWHSQLKFDEMRKKRQSHVSPLLPESYSVTAFRTSLKTHISDILYSMQRSQFLTLLKQKQKQKL